jgi:ABC-type uncharacterized transport system permease subunit
LVNAATNELDKEITNSVEQHQLIDFANNKKSTVITKTITNDRRNMVKGNVPVVYTFSILNDQNNSVIHIHTSPNNSDSKTLITHVCVIFVAYAFIFQPLICSDCFFRL